METILLLIANLRTWTIITSSERTAMKDAFMAPWSDSPDQHLSAYTPDFIKQQNNTKKYDVKITDDDKVTQLVACIYEADII